MEELGGLARRAPSRTGCNSPGNWPHQRGVTRQSTASTSPAYSNSVSGSPADGAPSSQVMAPAEEDGEESDDYGSSVADDETAPSVASGDTEDEQELQRQCEAEFARAASFSPTHDNFREVDEWCEDDSESSAGIFDNSNDSGGSFHGDDRGENYAGAMDFGAENSPKPAIAGSGGGVFENGYHSDSEDDPDASFDLLAHCAGSASDEDAAHTVEDDSSNPVMGVKGDGEIYHGSMVNTEVRRSAGGRLDERMNELGSSDEDDDASCSPAGAEKAGRGPSCSPERNTTREAAMRPMFSVNARIRSPSPLKNTAPDAAGPRFSMGTGAPSPSSGRATRRGASALSPHSPARNAAGRRGSASSRSPVSNKKRGTARQRSSKSGGGTNHESVTPQRAVSGPSKTPLRRSPRVAAAAAAAAASAVVPSGVDAVTSALTNARKRAGPGSASISASGVATPYSTRRARRANAASKAFTPGAESSAGGDGGMDSSFCTAIMGDGSPVDGSVLNTGNAIASRDGPVFEKTPDEGNNKASHNLVPSMTDSEPTPTLPNSLEAARYLKRPGATGAAAASVLPSQDNNDDMTALGARMSTLSCAGGDTAGEHAGQAPASEGAGMHMSPSMVESLSDAFAGVRGSRGAPLQEVEEEQEASMHWEEGNTAAGAMADDSSKMFAPPSPAVGVPSTGPSLSPRSGESTDEESPFPPRNAGGGGGGAVTTTSTFGMGSFDGREDAVMAAAFARVERAANFTLPTVSPPPPSTVPASAASARPVPKVYQTRPDALSPDQGAGASSGGGIDTGVTFVAMNGDVAAQIVGAPPRSGKVLTRVEAEARELAAAIVQEEERRMEVEGEPTAAMTKPGALPVGVSLLSIGNDEEAVAPTASGNTSSSATSGSAAAKIKKPATGRSNGGSARSPRANGSIGFAKVNSVTRITSPARGGPNRINDKPAMVVGSGSKKSAVPAGGGVGVGGGATIAGVISMISAHRTAAGGGGVERPRRMSVAGGGPVVARRQSMAFGTSSPATAAATAARNNTVGVTRASSRERGRLGGRAASTGRGVGVGGGGGADGGAGRRDAVTSGGGVGGGTSTEGAPGIPAEVPAVAATSHLLAPTASSQGRARPRSSSPAVASARGRSPSHGGSGSTLSMPPDAAAGGNRRISTGQALRAQPKHQQQQKPQQQQQQQPQQQQQQQPQQPRPRASSTGRRALTLPKTPNFRTTARVKGEKEQESTEEAEVRKVKEMQEQVKQMTRRNQVAMERSRRTAYSGNVRSSKPLTVPESPAMQTVGRLGGKVYAAVGSQVDQIGFSPTHPAKDDVLSREQAAQSGDAQAKGPTVPQPFRLSQSNRPVRVESSGEGEMTFRETLNRLEKKTPERFRTKPAGEQAKPTASVTAEPAKPTLPMSPRFHTDARAAVVGKPRILSREEREEAELAEMKKHQFKARPFRADGFGVGGEKGVFRPQHSDKKLTQPAPFRLSTEGRAEKRAPSPHRNRDEEELTKQFKARPMPSGRSSSVGRVRPGANVGHGAPDLRARQATLAASPMLTTKRRSAVRSSSIAGIQTSEQQELEEAATKQFKARPMPDYSRLATQGRRQSTAGEQSAALTSPRPFNLRSEERGKAKQALLAQRLEDKRRQEEAAQKVRARPAPTPSMGFVPAPCARPLTDTREFAFSSQARHERAQQQFRDRVRREEERARRATKVKALPLPQATFDPEPYPQRTEISLTEPVDVVLHSTARAEGRAQWDAENQARLDEEERLKVVDAEAAAVAEKMAIAEMRRLPPTEGGMSFKAQPIQYSNTPPEQPQLSTVPLTTPITPNLRTKRRAITAMNNREQQAPMA